MDRSEFIRRVRSATQTAVLVDSPPEDPGQWVPDLPEVDLVDHFRVQMEAVHGEVLTVPPAQAIAEVIERHSLESFVSWNLDQIDGLDALPESLERLDTTVPRDAGGRRELNASLHRAGLGITGAEAGFAESGSIVLRSGAGRSRMASVVPLVHVAVLRRERIVRSVSHWMAAEGAGVGDAANVLFITGPSKTGDIEMILTLGVHGPRYLYVVLI